MNLDILPVKLVFFTLLLWPISRVWLRIKDGSVSVSMFIFWTLVWFVGVFLIFFPGALTFIAALLGIGRGSDMAVYFAIGILFYLIFRTNVALEDLHDDISRIVRELALSDSQDKSNVTSKKKSNK